MQRIVHFDIEVDNPDRAIAFYKKAFGWSIEKWNGPMDYWMVKTGEGGEPGINGGLSKGMQGQKHEPGHGFQNTIGVENIDEAIEKVKAAGGKILIEKNHLPEVGWFAQVADTEGNVVGLMQSEMKMPM